ncbi:MAG: Ubiquitin fusion degradation protein 4 [Vezdaea aestivalis]|nr:MAG: Ubiquitin fusion degradation protein 4 [Vezdaea aestivalis]
MSPRATRSSARLQAAAALAQAPTPALPSVAADSQPARPPTTTRKRKASSILPNAESTPAVAAPNKRRKVGSGLNEAQSTPSEPPSAPPTRARKSKQAPKMSSPPAAGPSNPAPEVVAESSTSAKPKTARSKKTPQASASTIAAPPKKLRKNKALPKRPEPSRDSKPRPRSPTNNDDGNDSTGPSSERDSDAEMADEMEADMDEEDSFGFPHSNLSSTLRALTGMMTGIHSRLRDILAKLKQKDDPSVQLVALHELSETLLVSTEDNLSGHFSPDQFVKELVTLMRPADDGGDSYEMMLVACRCIANLMEALPASTANVVYGGAVPILCSKLLEIEYIDLAEQALSTLEKISVEFPSSIVREGGLTACLTFLDFFATSTQRTAVTTAANCCRNIPSDSFPVVRDVMPILLNVLGSSDQKVVEQACLCVSRVVESFKYQQDKLEILISPDLLRVVLRLLLPGTTNLIGPNIHTQFLRVLAITARASPSLSVELFKMNVVDTLYQILTGVSPPDGTEDVASKIDSVIVMQALIHRPREQVVETLNVICELLPSLPSDSTHPLDDELFGSAVLDPENLHRTASQSSEKPSQDRLALLQDCKNELKRFAVILLPTLTDAYSSTVNLSVRQKVLNAQLKMLSNLDSSILEEALRLVPYASHLASILSQQDHPTLVVSALQAAELLLQRLDHIYRYQFYREGVMTEIEILANQPLLESGVVLKTKAPEKPPAGSRKASRKVDSAEDDSQTNGDEDSSDLEVDEDEIHDDMTESPSPVSSQVSSSSSSSGRHAISSVVSNTEEFVKIQSKKFLELHENEESGKAMRAKAFGILKDLKSLATSIEQCCQSSSPAAPTKIRHLFKQLAGYFDGDAVESITSSELLNSSIARVLLDVFNTDSIDNRVNPRAAFLETFMSRSVRTKAKTISSTAPSTPFSVLVYKLQDLLSRAEHFEVVTVHHNAFDGNRSSAASMLAKQLRIKLVAGEDSQIPRDYRSIMVSIHAIATFKALDDYLRPRLTISHRSRGGRSQAGISSALAAFAAAAGVPHPHHHRFTERGFPFSAQQSPVPSNTEKAVPRPLQKTGTKSKTTQNTAADQSAASTPQEKPSSTRRSSRRAAAQGQIATPPPPPPPPPPMTHSEQVSTPLECADEKRMADDDELEDNSALEALMDDLDEQMADLPGAEPSAVDLEVAPTGKVTARKEDGTRIATPSAPTSSSKPKSNPSLPPPLAPVGSSTHTPVRPGSYSAALQAAPQDWHIEFSMGGKVLSSDTTIYRAVHQHESPEDTARGLWSGIHTINFKRVSGPRPTASNASSPKLKADMEGWGSGLPESLDRNPVTSVILRLLNILHALNSNLDDVLLEDKNAYSLNAEPLSQFVNTKLTAKLNRQLEEPLIVASNCLPSWSEDLAQLYPFLFPFETRHLFLQSTSFGYSRSMSRWQNAQTTNQSRQDRHRDERPFMGRLQRQKVRISRAKMLESAVKVMELYGSSTSMLEVEYFEEVGTGLGPTLEFYSIVSKEFSKSKMKMWRENDMIEEREYAFGKRGLFPAPMSPDFAASENGKKILHLFKMLGKFVARSMLDSRIIDVSFNPTFFRINEKAIAVSPSLGAVKTVDRGLANSLKLLKQFADLKKSIDEDTQLTSVQKAAASAKIMVTGAQVEDLGLDFTLPGYPTIELVANGSNTSVGIENVGLYIDKVIDFTLGQGVQNQVDAFRAGFSQVFPYTALRAFTPDELVMLFGRVDEDWSLETLLDSIKADHGFNMDSKSVRNLLQTMSELKAPERRDFLQFVTGSPKLPIGGFKSLTPMFTVVCKPSEPPYTSDDYLPSVMTCVNYLKLPDYTNREVMSERLNLAIKEGQGAFHLS